MVITIINYNNNKKNQERFCMIKDKIKLYNSNLEIKCVACHQFQHGISNCPYLHLNMKKEMVISKYNKSIQKDRVNFQRKKKKKFRNFIDFKKIKDDLKKVRISLVVNFLN